MWLLSVYGKQQKTVVTRRFIDTDDIYLQPEEIP